MEERSLNTTNLHSSILLNKMNTNTSTTNNTNIDNITNNMNTMNTMNNNNNNINNNNNNKGMDNSSLPNEAELIRELNPSPESILSNQQLQQTAVAANILASISSNM